MTSKATEKRVLVEKKEEKHKQQDQASSSNSGDTRLGHAVASAVDTGVIAVLQVGNAVFSHIPGTDEQVLHQFKKEIERTGVDRSVVDGSPMPRQPKNIEKTGGEDEARKLHKTLSTHPDC